MPCSLLALAIPICELLLKMAHRDAVVDLTTESTVSKPEGRLVCVGTRKQLDEDKDKEQVDRVRGQASSSNGQSVIDLSDKNKEELVKQAMIKGRA